MSIIANGLVIEQLIVNCLKELDDSEYPLPYLSSAIFGHDSGKEWIYNAIRQNEYNNVAGSNAVTYEVAKFHRGSIRPLHYQPVPEAVEYHSLARHLGVRSRKLQNDISFSFKPNLSSTSEIWFEFAAFSTLVGL